jgi:hypothetical protein
MRTITALGTVVLLLGWCGSAQAQYQVGPIYPERQEHYQSTWSGRNPYRFDWRTGSFNYVPVPYAPEPAGSSYDPYRFNMFTGVWDYMPLPGRSIAPENNGGGEVSVAPPFYGQPIAAPQAPMNSPLVVPPSYGQIVNPPLDSQIVTEPIDNQVVAPQPPFSAGSVFDNSISHVENYRLPTGHTPAAAPTTAPVKPMSTGQRNGIGLQAFPAATTQPSTRAASIRAGH